MILYFDGPEKAGKSTLIGMAKERLKFSDVRQWGLVPNDDVYLEPLIADASEQKWTAWDRGWASEHVYAKLLGRNRRLGDDPWLGEWYYGRIAEACGVKIMLLPLNIQDAESRRDSTDLPVSPLAESLAFLDYARRFGWTVLYNEYTERSDRENVDKIERLVVHKRNSGPLGEPYWLGPRDAKVIFAVSMNNLHIPFIGEMTTALGRRFGDDALKCAWVTTGQPPELLDYRTVVLIGADDGKLVYNESRTNVLHLETINDEKQIKSLVEKVKEILHDG